MHGKPVRQNCRAAKLKQWKRLDQTNLKIGVEKTAIHPHRRCFQGEVAKDILADQLRDGGAAIDEAAGYGDAFVVVVFQSPLCASDRVGQARRASRAAITRGRADGASGP